jgi:hypothetical protein
MAFLRNTSDPNDPYLYCASCGQQAGSTDDRHIRNQLEQHSWDCSGSGQCEDRQAGRG